MEPDRAIIIQQAVHNILLAIEGGDSLRSGVVDTPTRVRKMYEELFSGYTESPSTILETQFRDDGLSEYEGMVVVSDIPFTSYCEHHMCPFHGKAHIGYLPDRGVVGLSKFARLVQCFAKRLQVQERMTQQISDAIQDCLHPHGVIVVIRALHTCMTMRGVKSHSAETVTSVVTGKFRTEASARAEFLSLIKEK